METVLKGYKYSFLSKKHCKGEILLRGLVNYAEQSRSITVCVNVLILELFLAFGHSKAYIKQAQKTRKNCLERAFGYFTISEMLGGGCCCNFKINLIKVYISIFSLILIATSKTICIL